MTDPKYAYPKPKLKIRNKNKNNPWRQFLCLSNKGRAS